MDNFTITQDGKTIKISKPKRTPDGVYAGVRLQGEMFLYDLLHGTNYRTIRNRLYREQRNRQFEQKIGLVRAK